MGDSVKAITRLTGCLTLLHQTLAMWYVVLIVQVVKTFLATAGAALRNRSVFAQNSSQP
jgi:hypothetical protein